VLSTNDVIALIQCGNEYGVEVDRPDAVIGFLKSDVLVDERVGDVEKLIVEAERATGCNLLYDEVTGVLENRKPRRIGARRYYIPLAR